MRWFADLLFPLRSDEAVLRDVESDAFVALLSPHGVPTTFPLGTALLPLKDPRVRAAIHEAKYRRSEHAFELLASALSRYLERFRGEVGEIVVIPVPIAPARLAERGYNQVEEVATRACAKLGLELAPSLLTRVRDTDSQVLLPRPEREVNVRGAFRAAGPLDPKKNYVLLDDVTTTGATLQAALDALSEGGAEILYPVALAR